MIPMQCDKNVLNFVRSISEKITIIERQIRPGRWVRIRGEIIRIRLLEVRWHGDE